MSIQSRMVSAKQLGNGVVKVTLSRRAHEAEAEVTEREFSSTSEFLEFLGEQRLLLESALCLMPLFAAEVANPNDVSKILQAAPATWVLDTDPDQFGVRKLPG